MRSSNQRGLVFYVSFNIWGHSDWFWVSCSGRPHVFSGYERLECPYKASSNVRNEATSPSHLGLWSEARLFTLLQSTRNLNGHLKNSRN